jgi:hypothetical protein
MNKKGTEKILAMYWFAILILVAGGIFAMVTVFYGSSYDVRDIEANILADKIADCLSEGGYLKGEVFDGNFLLNETNFLEKCHLNFNTEDKWEEEQYYIEINLYGVEDTTNSVFNFNYGNNKWLSSCEIQKEEEYGNLAKCVEKRFYSLDGEIQYLIKILSVVRKTEKNAK